MSRKNALSRGLKTLASIKTLQSMWEQEKGESEKDYWAFMDWLDKGSNRGAPPAKYLEQAAKYRWTERALAYERATELAVKNNEGTGTPEQRIVQDLVTTVQIEAEKLLKASAGQRENVMSVKDVLATVGLIKELQEAAIKARSQQTDLSGFSKEDLNKILEAQALLRKGKSE